MERTGNSRPEADASRCKDNPTCRHDRSLSDTNRGAVENDPSSSASYDQRVDLDDVIDAAEAAHLLGVGREHVVKLLQRGQLAGKRLTGTWVTTRQAVDAYARNRNPRGRPRSSWI